MGSLITKIKTTNHHHNTNIQKLIQPHIKHLRQSIIKIHEVYRYMIIDQKYIKYKQDALHVDELKHKNIIKMLGI